jgi:probable phosphoglycerate mutase
MTLIYLVRHGNTAWTGHRLIGSIPGIHLDESGRSQAESIADFLAGYPIEAVYSSPYERAIETASPLASRLHLSVTQMDYLKEINFGDLCGMGVELSSLPAWKDFREHPSSGRFPNGESVSEAQHRIVEGLNFIYLHFPGKSQVVCVAHCEILRLAVAYALNIPLDDYMRLTIDPASISCLDWGKDHQSIKFLNDIK